MVPSAASPYSSRFDLKYEQASGGLGTRSTCNSRASSGGASARGGSARSGGGRQRAAATPDIRPGTAPMVLEEQTPPPVPWGMSSLGMRSVEAAEPA